MKAPRNASEAFAPSAVQRGVQESAGPVSRRHFLASSAGFGLAAIGIAPLQSGCLGDDDPPARPTHQRTLFFNLSNERHAGKTYYLTGGGRRFTLVPRADQPEVLARERQSNAFLRSVSDDQITHHIEVATFASDSVTLCYVSSEIDPQAGTWSMSSVQMYIPPEGAAFAYASARLTTASGPLPLSAKRRRYGAPAASSAQDLRDERALFDTTSHAATVVGGYPDLMGLDPNVAHAIHSNHIDVSADVYLLNLKLNQAQYGAATPEQMPGQPNASGWATLRPVPGDGGMPLKNKLGQHAGRIQYQPSLHPDLHALAAGGMTAAVQTVTNDASLGADATGLEPPTDQPNPALAGAMWLRHDGTTKVDQSPGQLFDADAKMTPLLHNGQVGYQIKASSTQVGEVIRVSLTILNFFLEFRGVWLQFFEGDKLLKLADVPEYLNGTIIAQHDRDSDTATEMYVSGISPVFTVLAIPTAPGFIQPSFNVPARATKVRILSSTMSFQGGNAYPDTVLQGAIMTGVFSYGATTMLAALGGATLIPAMYKQVVMPFLQALTGELIAFINAALNPNGDHSNLISMLLAPGFLMNEALVLGKVLVSTATSVSMRALVGFMAAAVSEGAAEDAVPVVGQVMQALSIVVGLLNLAQTSTALALTPWTYVDDLVFTHDLSVTILKDSGNPNANPPDPGDDTFPKAANLYIVTALVENSTPYVQTFELGAPVPSTLPPVVFHNLPLGGNVTVSVAFVQKAVVPGQPDVLLAKGSTGSIANDVNAAPRIEIEELSFPISAQTVYQHRQKTVLDANGKHLWAAGPAPTANLGNTGCGAAGTLCGYGGITVQQGTAGASGYVGYAWRGQDSDPSRVPGCAAGQRDQLANLNTDSGNNGANAQQGYVVGGCGIIVPGVRVAYSLLSQGATNFYLDTTQADAPMVRQVVLEPTPSIASPTSGLAWGALNFPSDALLLHPAGYLVSINGEFSKLETHRIPSAAIADADALVQLRAQLHCGKGSRPGLLDLPVASAVSADGVILVLEAGNNRIQALDLGANPVRHFNKLSGPGSSPYSLTLGGTDPTQGWLYLDLAVEYTGFMYVLSFNQNSFVYRLDIYHPDQADNRPIATTMDINAARLTVDFWRNVYTLNYEVLRLPNGNAAALTEPSVSLWTPCDVGRTC